MEQEREKEIFAKVLNINNPCTIQEKKTFIILKK
jgi:hypothetical protein